MATQSARDLKSAMTLSLKQYDRGNKKWFSHLAKGATVYAIGTTTPFVGRAAYEKHFLPILTSGTRKTRVLDQKIKYVNNLTAVVTQTLQITQGGIVSVVRQSVVWSLDQEWLIVHLHSALVGAPTGVAVPSSPRGIRVINERIATVAATVGVAQ